IPYKERRRLLENIVKEDSFAKIMPMTLVKTDSEVEDILENAINTGCEGLMLKQLDSPYRAGARGSNWLKLKREYRNELGDSLDLVVIGAFYGRGRRTGRYGALLLAAYDEQTDTFPSICKVGTGFTDESLDQFYQILSDKITIKKDLRIDSGLEADVWFEPEVVIEIVASEITLSPIHKVAMDKIRKGSGLALRFPKFTGRIRFEKTSENATTIDEIITLYNNQKKVAQDEGQALRRKITREIADVGGLMMNRENLLNTAYTMDEIAGYITGIAFKLSNIKAATLKKEKIEEDLSELIELAVDQIYKLNEVVR